MTINLTPHELVYLYESLLTAPISNSEQQDARQAIVSKARASLLEKLEKVSAESNKAQFEIWVSQEAKKVKDLEKKNNAIKANTVKTSTKKTRRK